MLSSSAYICKNGYATRLRAHHSRSYLTLGMLAHFVCRCIKQNKKSFIKYTLSTHSTRTNEVNMPSSRRKTKIRMSARTNSCVNKTAWDKIVVLHGNSSTFFPRCYSCWLGAVGVCVFFPRNRKVHNMQSRRRDKRQIHTWRENWPRKWWGAARRALYPISVDTSFFFLRLSFFGELFSFFCCCCCFCVAAFCD